MLSDKKERTKTIQNEFEEYATFDFASPTIDANIWSQKDENLFSDDSKTLSDSEIAITDLFNDLERAF